MTPAAPASRLAQSLGPLGLIGSILLHGVVLAALLERPNAPQPETSRVFHVALAVAPTPNPDPAPDPVAPSDSPVPAPLSERPWPESPPASPVAHSPAPPVPSPVVPPKRPLAKPTPKTLAPKSAASVDPAAETPPRTMPPETAQAAPAPGPIPEPTPGPILNPPPAPVQITRLRARDQRPPIYPELARRDELEGTVRLKLIVSPSGQVEEATILKSSGHRLLDQAAQNAARLWHLYPAEFNGNPVAGWAEVEIPFRLTD